jgi:hypothetical protein
MATTQSSPFRARRESVKAVDMKRFLFPLFLIALGILGITEHDAITGQWTAMYLQDAARQDALQQCYEENQQFNRFSATARANCYQKYYLQSPGGTAQGPYTPPVHVLPQVPPVPANQ